MTSRFKERKEEKGDRLKKSKDCLMGNLGGWVVFSDALFLMFNSAVANASH